MNNYVDFGFGRLQFDTFLSGHVLDLHSKTTMEFVEAEHMVFKSIELLLTETSV